MIFQGSNSVLQEHGTVIDQLQDPGRSSRIGGGRCASPVVWPPAQCNCTVGLGRARRSNGDAWHRRGKRKGEEKKETLMQGAGSQVAAGYGMHTHTARYSGGTSAERPAHRVMPLGLDTQEHGGITYVQGTRG